MRIPVTIKLQTSLSRLVFISICLIGLFSLCGFFVPTVVQDADAAPLGIEQAIKNGAAEEPASINYLPLLTYKWPPAPPAVPALNPIQNADGDNLYEVIWTGVPEATTYTLQVATKQDFSDAVLAYEGPNISLPYKQGQPPCTYFYRVRANNAGGSSDWSAIQSITIFPLHVGLNLRWDGKGQINFDESIEVGTHATLYLDKMMDADKIRGVWQFWYDPNPDPEVWPNESYYAYYSVSNGNIIPDSNENESDSPWKWGYPWGLPYGASYTDGQTVKISGQSFTVHGPLHGQTGIGNIAYWEFTNQADILMYDDGKGTTQVVHPGNAILRYDAGPYGEENYADITRTLYSDGEPLRGWTVRYFESLTSMSTSPASQQAFNVTATGSEEGKIGSRATSSYLRPLPKK